jgi:hypothetical protein
LDRPIPSHLQEALREIVKNGKKTPLSLSRRFLIPDINASHIKVRLREW